MEGLLYQEKEVSVPVIVVTPANVGHRVHSWVMNITPANVGYRVHSWVMGQPLWLCNECFVGYSAVISHTCKMYVANEFFIECWPRCCDSKAICAHLATYGSNLHIIMYVSQRHHNSSVALYHMKHYL